MQGPLSLKNKMLSTPLLAKNSTPIRARITSNQTPINSTPINQLKICSTPIINKENINTSNLNTSNINFQNRSPFESVKENANPRQSGVFSKTITFGDCKFTKKPVQPIQENVTKNNTGPNLSPILALNRKINQFSQSNCFTTNNFRSLTPNNMKSPQCMQSSSKQKNEPKTFKTTGLPINQTLKQSTSNSDLRSSNSFSSLFQKRSKTPTRLGSLAFGSLSRKNNPSPGLKHESSFRTENNRYFSQKDSFFSNGIMNQSSSNSFGENEQMMCANNHGKTAKYRIKDREESFTEIEENENLVYCSKCAIELVQKGISVEELGAPNQEQAAVSAYISPREQSLRQSRSFKNNLLSFKTSYSSEMLQRLQTAQRLKSHIIEELSAREGKKLMIHKKFNQSIEDIDCFYNSVISYIEQIRAKDKLILETLQSKVQKQLLTSEDQFASINLQAYQQSLEQIIKSKNFDVQTNHFLAEVEAQLQSLDQKHQNETRQTAEILGSNFQMIHFASSIQDQFDEFVSYFDSQGRIQFKTFEELRVEKVVLKNNSLRFSFEKALQNQNRKKSLILESEVMNTLQEEPEEDYDENSFSHDHMKQTADNRENVEQKPPFRTLFAQEDNILEYQQEQEKNDMYSPNFKAI